MSVLLSDKSKLLSSTWFFQKQLSISSELWWVRNVDFNTYRNNVIAWLPRIHRFFGCFLAIKIYYYWYENWLEVNKRSTSDVWEMFGLYLFNRWAGKTILVFYSQFFFSFWSTAATSQNPKHIKFSIQTTWRIFLSFFCGHKTF